MNLDLSAEDDLETLDLRMPRVEHLPVYPLVSDNPLRFWQCLDPAHLCKVEIYAFVAVRNEYGERCTLRRHILVSKANGVSTVSDSSQTDKVSHWMLNEDTRLVFSI